MVKASAGRVTVLYTLLAIGISGASSWMAQSARSAETSTSSGIIKGVIRDSAKGLFGIMVTAKADGKNSAATVFTDDQGAYAFPPLPKGDYIISVGTKMKEKVTLSAASATRDFTIALGPDLFNQTTGGSILNILPGTDAEKKNLVANCGSCHSVWRAFNNARSTTEDWSKLVRRMGLKKGGYGSSDEEVAPRVDMSQKSFDWMVGYYSKNVSPELKKSKVVEALFRPRGEAAKAVFMEWDVPKALGGINTAKPDSKGVIWFPSGDTKSLGKLDPSTGEVKTWVTPVGDSAPGEEPPLHDIMIDRQDNVWLTGGGRNKVVVFNQKTEKMTMWDIPKEYGVKPHTGELDKDGNYWMTMQSQSPSSPGKGWVAKLDTHTGKVTGFATKKSFNPKYGPEPYGLVIDSKGTVWFTELYSGMLSMIDPKTGQMTEVPVPDISSGPRRLALDSKENLWFTECFSGKVGKYDPVTKKFSEFDLGIAGGGFPYSIRLDKSDHIWVTSNSHNSVSVLDPSTGKVTHALFPGIESTTIDPGFDTSASQTTLVYGTHRNAVGRVYFRK